MNKNGVDAKNRITPYLRIKKKDSTILKLKYKGGMRN